MTANNNALRKIDRALARGWTPREQAGPARYLRSRPAGRRARKQTGGRDEK
ncbi:MAG: hypothetical protein LBC18_07555 [Opitutaceae bacterium]|jgi:hypothetical protein|nr:hypothetical protein [Opitutaceae bacterium]